MLFARFLTTIAFGVASAAVIAEPAALEARNNLIEKRDCSGHASGTWWTGLTGIYGGCSWYYCEGSTIELWIDCGLDSCTSTDGVPECGS
jgi:hypothetical protein